MIKVNIAIRVAVLATARLAIHGHERQQRKIQDHERAGGKQDYLQDEDTMTITANETDERLLRLIMTTVVGRRLRISRNTSLLTADLFFGERVDLPFFLAHRTNDSRKTES